jgi:hypothetical protein
MGGHESRNKGQDVEMHNIPQRGGGVKKEEVMKLTDLGGTVNLKATPSLRSSQNFLEAQPCRALHSPEW